MLAIIVPDTHLMNELSLELKCEECVKDKDYASKHPDKLRCTHTLSKCLSFFIIELFIKIGDLL